MGSLHLSDLRISTHKILSILMLTELLYLVIVHMLTHNHQVKISELFFCKFLILFNDFADKNMHTKGQ